MATHSEWANMILTLVQQIRKQGEAVNCVTTLIAIVNCDLLEISQVLSRGCCRVEWDEDTSKLANHRRVL